MMSDDGHSDVESHFEEERELTIVSMQKRDSGWGRRIGIALLAIVAIVLVIAVPVTVTKNKESESSSSAAVGVGSDSTGGAQPTLTTEDPMESVTNETPKEQETTPKDEPDDSETTMEKPETKAPSGSPTTAPITITTTNDNEASTSTVEPAFTKTVCPANGTNSTNWFQFADDIVGESAHDLSGSAMDMSADGSIIAIGANSNDDNGENAGHVRVYQYQSDIGFFTRLGQELDGEGEGDWFGHSVALDASGKRLAAGGIWNDGTNGKNSGHVRVFDLSPDSNQWEQVGEDIDGEEEDDRFGTSISLSANGKRLVIGASRCKKGDINATEVGCAYIYDLVDDSWVLLEKLQGDSDGDMFGSAIQLSEDGEHMIVGAHRYDNRNGGPQAGQVKVFQFVPSEKSWFQVGAAIEGIFPGEWAGMTVSINMDGSRVAVGFPGDNMGIPAPGFSRVYELNNGVWEQMGTLDLEGGFSVALSRDGNRVAVGDYKGMNAGIISGHVYVYDFNTDKRDWEVVGEEINGKSQQMEMLGVSVALSADGARVAAGVPRAASDGSSEIGAARVFDLC
ncbi:Inherit from COG: Hemolysin-type calcium-binding [Seminavis robusta]|uniref:Inherit from COG: Hemolysin-type calcium-binding n=1 Tax=Seminavis robusta TaxID=568900 RepID=A0A9N8ECH9_9STRA|nr:Inherit from COG: Hemolysin-type calcium-binding [Seminavis robusta]|eukprot:Sro889_g216570.1 Inherit from COG: Hemolysin-type calcium-binding (565) ;mRNA; f:19059-20753